MAMEAVAMESLGSVRLFHGRSTDVGFFGEIGVTKRTEAAAGLAAGNKAAVVKVAKAEAELGAANKASVVKVAEAELGAANKASVVKVAEAELGAGNKAAVVKVAVAEAEAEAEAEAGAWKMSSGKGEQAGPVKKKKLVRLPVKIEYIRSLEAHPTQPPKHPRGLPEELLQDPPESEEEQELRDCLAEIAADLQSSYDKEMAILHQHYHGGGAYEEFYVEDSDDEGN